MNIKVVFIFFIFFSFCYLGRLIYLEDNKIFLENLKIIENIHNENKNCYKTLKMIEKKLIKNQNIVYLISKNDSQLKNDKEGMEFKINNIFKKEFGNHYDIDKKKHVDCLICVSITELHYYRLWKYRTIKKSVEKFSIKN